MGTRPLRWLAWLAVAGGLIMLGRAVLYRLAVKLFGPPTVAMHESSAHGDADFDHTDFDGLLRAHVDAQGRVDYPGLAKAGATLDAYLDRLAAVDPARLTRDAHLALLINAYNAFTLRLILDHWPLASIKDIPKARRWLAERWTIGGHRVSLDTLEHAWLRPRFLEPRLHFAINCASVGCPPLRDEAYTAQALEAQLTDQARRMHADTRWVRLERGVLHLTPIYLWYQDDFRQASGGIRQAVAKVLPAAGTARALRWLPYDWGINAQP